MAILRLFASAREAAGTARDVVDGDTVDDVLAAACERFGPSFAAVLSSSQVWCNGEPVDGSWPVSATDEVAVLPPVSGGSDAPGGAEARRSEVDSALSERPDPRLALAPGPPDGPVVTIGVTTFVFMVASALAGPGWAAALFSGMAGGTVWALGVVAGEPTDHPRHLVLTAGAAALPLAALEGAHGLAVALPLIVATALIAHLDRSPGQPRHQMASLGVGLVRSLAVGFAASAPVLAASVGTGPVLTLLVLAGAYDTGAFLIGSGADATWEGPVAGAIATGVAAFPLGVVNAPGTTPWTLALVTVLFAALAPAGVLTGSMLLALARTGPTVGGMATGEGTAAVSARPEAPELDVAGLSPAAADLQRRAMSVAIAGVRRLDSLLVGGMLTAWAIIATRG